ncbi:flagellin [Blastococcus sp. MG754426]|uniref:flagellin N-terminal helical domain-containing protein n=1 Tax=unclassified Blastococcus TaxID=2619396 RepID=UPI001EF16014|nr:MULTISPECIES: flagellin [unclassified Blastococcus]MCF6509333.1 flagellin [Blastococcus sp. MG754426]MCF6513865.1 flagellin [Blastococcus sp. MG754427]MCF6736702.1 flagellin [Blastococcus sp. KM273129]MCF6745833.1 flagellin [Blastococcus sp. KM273128]
MGLRINQNIAALNAHRNLSITDSQMSKSLEKLSSGFRINRAADDAAGLAISEGLRSQVGGLKVAVRNAQDGVSVVQTAEGALTEVHSILQRVRDLTVQAGNTGVVDEKARGYIAKEVEQLKGALDNIADRTDFNGTKLLQASGGSALSLTFQTGANGGETVSVTLSNVTAVASAIGTVATNLAASGTYNASADLTSIDTQIKQVSSDRATLGASQNRFESTINSLNVSIENLSASESRVRDADMAQEMVGFTRAQILSQAGTAMLAQANQASQGVLSLLR